MNSLKLVVEDGVLKGFSDESHYLLFLGRIENEYIAILLPKEEWGKEGLVENAILAKGRELLSSSVIEEFYFSSVHGVWQLQTKDCYLVKNGGSCFFGRNFREVETVFPRN